MLIRRLPSVETLGCTTVNCTDKTGTLTQNEMTVRSIFINNSFVDLTGTGYNPEGDFEKNHSKIDPTNIPGLLMALKICVLCNGAELHPNHEDSKAWNIVGDPTEGALLTVARKAGFLKKPLEQANPFISEIPFDSDPKRMSIVWYKEGLSFTISDKKKPGIYKKIQNVMQSVESIWVMIGATVVLAAGGSLVEFTCTAGFPVLWSNLLISQNVTSSEFVMLLLVYLFVYQLDELGSSLLQFFR